MEWWTVLGGLAAGLSIAVVTAPVGVSGAVFLLPVQLSVFGVPNPAVTPTNLLFNLVAGPGALWRHNRTGVLHGPLTRRLVTGTVPGVVLGATIRVFALPGPGAFRILIAALLLPLGLWLCARTLRPAPARGTGAATAADGPPSSSVTVLALAVGIVGGIYGIGGTHNRELHEVNLRWHPRAEDVLWRPDLQETERSENGALNVRYASATKAPAVSRLRALVAARAPWLRIRYAF
ncbi:putative membrane protein YfcA [Streptomyces sp. B4I13]|uniref:TSUP family transporter n=1 Tax=Streptomyces sp. B4I13 TaxID=3042271 RepID=UPI002781D24B|nr:TSUP family transporter [Streptomyces sp. B4I13]MDQ0956672.1 putative membrane protein YfcA [Streptomyces sp. B4I13]